jgi:Icc-related predicted phosphoesterase
LDKCNDGTEAGCYILQQEIFNRIKPQLVVFGHIHEAKGHELIDGIHFVNASTCNFRYKPVNPAYVVDIPCTGEDELMDNLASEMSKKLGL